MILDPEMRTLLKQLADNTGRLARAVEAVLDASTDAPGGGRMDTHWCEGCDSCHHVADGK